MIEYETGRFLQDIVVDKDQLNKVKIIPVTTIEEVLEHVLDWNGKKSLKDKIINGKKKTKVLKSKSKIKS